MLSESKGLAIQRGGTILAGNYKTQVSLLELDFTNAQNVLPDLTAGRFLGCVAPSDPCKEIQSPKVTVLADLNALLADKKISTVDNIEALFLGPKSPNGNKTLWLISDNNFSATQVTQILVFEINE